TDLAAAISASQGAAMTQWLFTNVVWSRRELRERKNLDLLRDYERSGLSVKKFAAAVADSNRSLHALYRWGPHGSTDARTLEKHIARLKKSAKYRKPAADIS